MSNYLDGNADLDRLYAHTSPVLQITGAKPVAWCRPMSNPNDPRIGPWRYEAIYKVLDQDAWDRDSEVLYMVVDSGANVRAVGKSMNRLRDRWRTSPMYDAVTKAPLGRKALFHSTAWREIEQHLAQNPGGFTVRAAFPEQMHAACRGSALLTAVANDPARGKHLAERLETWVCSLKQQGLPLWNKTKT